jgi:hypothetical protein
MADVLLPRELAEKQFKSASAEAALFELRMRMLAGTIPQTRDRSIDIPLSHVRPDLDTVREKRMLVQCLTT